MQNEGEKLYLELAYTIVSIVGLYERWSRTTEKLKVYLQVFLFLLI